VPPRPRLREAAAIARRRLPPRAALRHDRDVITTVPVQQGPRPVWLDRLIAGGVVAAAFAITGLLLAVDPDPKGYDTHVRLGMAPCSWPRTHGMPCPTCGATTAACLLVHGHPLAALATQPFGAAIAAAGLLLGAIATWCLLRARSFLDVWVQLPRGRLLLAGVALLLLAWLYKSLVFLPPT